MHLPEPGGGRRRPPPSHPLPRIPGPLPISLTASLAVGASAVPIALQQFQQRRFVPLLRHGGLGIWGVWVGGMSSRGGRAPWGPGERGGQRSPPSPPPCPLRLCPSGSPGRLPAFLGEGGCFIQKDPHPPGGALGSRGGRARRGPSASRRLSIPQPVPGGGCGEGGRFRTPPAPKRSQLAKEKIKPTPRLAPPRPALFASIRSPARARPLLAAAEIDSRALPAPGETAARQVGQVARRPGCCAFSAPSCL